MKGTTESRGGFGKVARALSVLRNYGVTSERFEESLEAFRRFLQKNRCPATFACPSALLGKSDSLVAFLKEFDVAIHGMEHIDYTEATVNRIEGDLRQAISEFESVGLKPSGFRAPYLRWNRAIIKALASSGLAYDSSESVVWGMEGVRFASLNSVRRVLEFYASEKEDDSPSLPRIEHGVVRLPVSLPDDEILIERLAIHNPEDLLSYWLGMLRKSYEGSKLLVLQIHPERFPICEEALGSLLEEVRTRNVWNATLSDVASWWKERSVSSPKEGESVSTADLPREGLWPEGHQSAFCMTGDVDAISVRDFLRRTVAEGSTDSRRRP
jgi:peptidoglycan/xylan/chitin deacetylase (PgdA/CDA1 family)